MKTNQQEEMRRIFEYGFQAPLKRFVSDVANYYTDSKINSEWVGFKQAYTLQQEKIEKLEKLCGVHFNENGMHEIESYEKQIESLKSDLDWATDKYFEFGAEYPEIYIDDMNKIKEIRKRHNLGK